METLRHILMNSTEEDLSILSGYIIGIKHKNINIDNDPSKRYLYVNEIVSSFQTMGQMFFHSKMDYGDLVHKLAENMEVNLDKKTYIGIDFIELAVAKKYILNNFKYIPNKEKAELTKILDINSAELDADDKNVINRLSDIISDITAYKLITWLANATLHSFLDNEQKWDCGGINFFGRKEFREHVIYPIIYVIMLRHKFRYNQIPKCNACNAAIVPGAKFCTQCGTKLV